MSIVSCFNFEFFFPMLKLAPLPGTRGEVTVWPIERWTATKGLDAPCRRVDF